MYVEDLMRFKADVAEAKRQSMREVLYARDRKAARAIYNEERARNPLTEIQNLKTVAERNYSHQWMEWYNYWLSTMLISFSCTESYIPAVAD